MILRRIFELLKTHWKCEFTVWIFQNFMHLSWYFVLILPVRVIVRLSRYYWIFEKKLALYKTYFSFQPFWIKRRIFMFFVWVLPGVKFIHPWSEFRRWFEVGLVDALQAAQFGLFCQNIENWNWTWRIILSTTVQPSSQRSSSSPNTLHVWLVGSRWARAVKFRRTQFKS